MLYYVRECRTPPYHVYVACFVFKQEKALKGMDNASDYATSALEEHAPSRQAFKKKGRSRQAFKRREGRPY
jgi:hypothetical protein